MNRKRPAPSGAAGEIPPAPERSALDDAVRLLSRRPRTRAEVRDRLARRGHPAGEIDDALARLAARGIVDDAALARHWIEVRAARRGYGPGRLIRELESRGVPPEVARRALEDSVREGAVEPREILDREAVKRVAALRGDRGRRAYARVYNSLLRAGFDPGEIHEALARHFSGPVDGPDASPTGTGTDDDDIA